MIRIIFAAPIAVIVFLVALVRFAGSGSASGGTYGEWAFLIGLFFIPIMLPIYAVAFVVVRKITENIRHFRYIIRIIVNVMLAPSFALIAALLSFAKKDIGPNQGLSLFLYLLPIVLPIMIGAFFGAVVAYFNAPRLHGSAQNL